jgi:hypothetical protein
MFPGVVATVTLAVEAQVHSPLTGSKQAKHEFQTSVVRILRPIDKFTVTVRVATPYPALQDPSEVKVAAATQTSFVAHVSKPVGHTVAHAAPSYPEAHTEAAVKLVHAS